MQITIDQVPLYRVMSGRSFYDCGSSTYIGSEEEFEWDGEPSEDLEPLNQSAQANMQRFFERVDSLPRRKNPSNQATDMVDALTRAFEGFAQKQTNVASFEKIETAAAALGVDPAAMLAALGLDEPKRIAAPEEFEIAPVRRAVIADSEPEDRPLTSAKMQTFRNKLTQREPKPRGRPKKVSISSHAGAY